MRAEQVTDPLCYHGEGPVWAESWGGLRWVDMLAGDVLALEAPLAAGFRVPEQGATVIAAADLFGPEAAVAGGVRAMLPMGEVDLRPGDVAVDRDHGLCVFEGL